jgi:hypothetical protein
MCVREYIYIDAFGFDKVALRGEEHRCEVGEAHGMVWLCRQHPVVVSCSQHV